MPYLSIITVNKNNAAGLSKTLRSAMEQTCRDFEHIIIDGGSTDGSVDVIRSFTTIPPGRYTAEPGPEPGNSPITYWISAPDQGIYHAMNKGIGFAGGGYLLFLNSGDWFVHDRSLADFMAHKLWADIVSGDIYFYDTKKNEMKWHVPSPEHLTAKTLFMGTLPHQATLIKKRLFDQLGMYSQDLKIASDWLFFVAALLENHYTYQHVPVTLSCFAMDGISCSSETGSLPRREQLMVLNQKYPRMLPDYEALDRLEKYRAGWESSREYVVFHVLKKLGVIRAGVLVLRLFRAIKRRMGYK
jgi:glycosyltransferase involved in cell wall biosynthesis